MSDELALAPKTFAELQEMSKVLSFSSIIPAALRQSPANVAIVIMAGRELGIGPLAAIQGIDVIDGHLAHRAALITGLCLKRRELCEGIDLLESTPTRATYQAKRAGRPVVKMSFTIEQAKQANLLGKKNWRDYPDAMLRARCSAAICRAVFPDLVGNLYTEDELEDEVPLARIPGAATGTVIAMRQEATKDAPPKAYPDKLNPVDVQEPPPQTDADAPPPNTEDAQFQPDAPNTEPSLAEQLEVRMGEAQTMEQLNAIVGEAKGLPESEKAALRRTFNSKAMALRRSTK